MYGRVSLLRGLSQRETPIKLIGGSSGRRPSSGHLPVVLGVASYFAPDVADKRIGFP